MNESRQPGEGEEEDEESGEEKQRDLGQLRRQSEERRRPRHMRHANECLNHWESRGSVLSMHGMTGKYDQRAIRCVMPRVALM